MAEGVLYDLAGTALTALAEPALRKAVSWWGARDDLKTLEETIKMIQAQVRDAERYLKDQDSDTIKEQLRRVRMVLYQADDLFDEVLTVNREKQQIEVNKQVCLSFSRSGTLCFNWKISREIKSIRQQLDKINSDIAGLNLISYHDHREEPLPLRAKLISNRETGSYVEAKDVIGRDYDKNNIIGMLCDGGKRVTVIPIVGFGGLGKTTLAQLVYNDEVVRNHFNLFAWAHVPEVDNKNQVLRKVCRSLRNDKDTSQLNVDEIKSIIRKEIKDKNFLLVLDDIRDDENLNNWLDLIALLECGANGGRVIITTRSTKLAEAVRTTEVYNLDLLPKDQSWNLFKKFTFRSEQEESDPDLSRIGMEIVDSCGNVPLAIKVVGSLLRSESEKHWRRVKDTRLSKAKGKEDEKIKQVLRLSYYYLPPNLKQCFAYCSLFPKNYEYSMNHLVKLWMAQGYFDQSRINVGEQYFEELLGRNLFQGLEKDDKGDFKCKMHDLVHDLAQDIAGEEIKQMVVPSNGNAIDDGLIHMSVEVPEDGPEDGGWEAPKSLLAARKMRSLMLLRHSDHTRCTIKASSLEMMFLKFQSLRALDLEYMYISAIPNSIGKLRHLRYLNLANVHPIKCLPDDISRLQNLQTLNIKDSSIKELPRDFGKFANLRHLGIGVIYSHLSDLPTGFGKLKSLQELDKFIVGKNNGIDSLPAVNLIGNLFIEFCKWRVDAVLEAQRATLKDNQQLTRLKIYFESMEESVEDEMLKCLPLPPELKIIEVGGYKGVSMPRRWFDCLSKLVVICIEDCSNCRVLPHLSQLPRLKHLSLNYLYDLEYVEYVDDILMGSGAHDMYFPALEFLDLYDMSSLKGWTRPSKDDDDGSDRRQLLFPRLLKMILSICPKLLSVPLAPKLESLKVGKINWKLFETTLDINW